MGTPADAILEFEGKVWYHRMIKMFDGGAGHSDEEIDKDMALAYMGLRHTGSGHAAAPDSADPTWLDRESPPPTVPVISEDAPSPQVAFPLWCKFKSDWDSQVQAGEASGPLPRRRAS